MKVEIRNKVLVTAALTVSVLSAAAATEPQAELQRNPFSRPAAEELTGSERPANQGLSVESTPGLRAVLVAGENSVVNIGGVILQVGECAETYCLLSVEEGKARLRRNDREIVLSLYEQEQGEER